MRALRLLGALIVAAAALAVAAPGALAWTPEPATYGVGSQTNQAVTMSDGTVLRANVYFPTDPKTGQEAAGEFPVILTQTPYGKDTGAAAGDSSLAELSGESTYLVGRGYIDVLVDVRGTGGSQGEFGLFDPVQGTDGASLVDWAAQRPHSDGDVGLLGASYLGINQFATAALAGPTHVKAMFPIIAGNDLYRDTAFAGGFPDIEFSAFYLGLTASLNLIEPGAEGNSDLATALIDHVHDLADFDAGLLGNVETGGDDAYDQTYWGQRNPGQYIQKIVADHIPAFLVGGWYDLFQRGELLNYAGFQNAYDGRAVLAPMAPSQPVTPRYQLIQGPWYHVTAGQGLDYHGLNLDGVELAWFDHWLKGVDTGITDTTTPMHLEDLSSGAYADVSRYPLDQATPTTYYLQPGSGLASATPPAGAAADTLAFTGSQIPCTSSTEQWAAGLGPLALSYFGLKDPCTQSTGLSQLGPGTQNYTTAPFTKPTTLAGPIGATLYASSTTADTEWVVQLSDVAPDGTATALTSGLLEGNQRALNPAMSWTAPDGKPLLPYHPYTKVAQTAVIPGQVTRYDVEVFPTLDTLAPGHRLRVTIATSDFPHALPTATQLPQLVGGVYSLQHSAAYPSSVELPLVAGGVGSGGSAGAGSGAGLPTTTSTPLGCPTATGRLTGDVLGPVHLGMTRTRARRAFVSSSAHGHKYMEFYCLTPLGIRVGFPSPQVLTLVASKQRARTRGTVVIALTANRHYALQGVRPHTRLATVARSLKVGQPFHVGKNFWYLTPGTRNRGVLKVVHGQIQEVGIAPAALLRTRAAGRRFFRGFY
jgi:putative CocE/NonD family hydrolase